MTKSTMRSRIALVVALGTAAASVLGAGPATAAARPGRHALPGSQPRWLGKARAIGSAPAAADKIQFGILLKLRDSASAQAKLASIADPASANYGKWLTTSQFKSQYAPASADVAAVSSWLQARASRCGARWAACTSRRPAPPPRSTRSSAPR